MLRKILVLANIIISLTFLVLVFSSGGGPAAILVFLVALLLAVNAATMMAGAALALPRFRLWRIWSDWLTVTEADLSARAAEIRRVDKQ